MFSDGLMATEKIFQTYSPLSGMSHQQWPLPKLESDGLPSMQCSNLRNNMTE
jgi:hypothetical protein